MEARSAVLHGAAVAREATIAPGVAATRRPEGRQAPAIVRHYASPKRVLGLDLFRISAALTILLYHGYWFGTLPILGRNPVTSRISTFGYLAVDLFFVLSGWLLAGQALRMRVSLRDGSFATFWGRRWLRTLPPYYVGLVAALLLAIVPGSRLTGGELLKHALFLQTVQLPNLYPVSWSLVTEEWFYLLLPVAVVLAAWLRRWPLIALLAGLMLLAPLGVRLSMLGHDTWLAILMTPQARFEGLVIGAVLAAIAVHKAAWWTGLLGIRRPLFLAGSAGIVILLAVSNQFDPWFQTFGLLGFCLLVGCSIPLLSSLRWPRATPLWLLVGVTFLSDLTYPIYLVHTVVPKVVALNQQSTFLYGAVWLLSVFLAAAALHLVVERPFLALRAKFVAYRRQVLAPRAASLPA